METLKNKPVVGMLTNNQIRGAGGVCFGAYLDRVSFAKNAGVDLIELTLRQENIALLLQQSPLKCRSWDGSLVRDEFIPFRDVAVIYDYTIYSLGNAAGYEEIRSEARKAGKQFINNHLPGDKWELHQIFTSSGIPTPQTAEFSPDAFYKLLANHGFIFIKPKNGCGGGGQITVRAQSDQYLVRAPGTEFKTASLEEAYVFCSENSRSNSIIQEGKVIQKIDGKVFDLRVTFQKDGQGEDRLTGTYMRLAAAGSDQANISRGGIGLDPMGVVPNYGQLTEKIIDIGKRLIRAIEATAGNVGEIGIDVVIDQKGDLFVLEFNDKLSYTALITLTQEYGERWRQVLDTFLARPMEYARYLYEAKAR